ncbi:MAG: antibiotic biosynthesis monooxygenase [Bacteroidia bacterium]
MINIKIDFVIKQDESLHVVRDIINNFIDNIRLNEPETVEYRSFQHSDDERHFFHLMSFKDEHAQLKHRNSAYCNHFVSKLYPLCDGEPKAVDLTKVREK